jgi:hypothetical protein
MIAIVKRGPGRLRPLDIVEVPPSRPDPRSADAELNERPDRAATQKISREALEEALRRTKSGTRRAVRSEHELPPNDADPRRERDSLPGPRDDDDVTTESVAPKPPLPTPMSAISAHMAPIEIRVLDTPDVSAAPERSDEAVEKRSLPVTPRNAFLAGLVIAIFLVAAAAIGFFAGRIVPGSPSSK